MQGRDSILVFASNLAACIGRNKYSPRADAFHALWTRLRPDSAVRDEAVDIGFSAEDASAMVASAPTHNTLESVRKKTEELTKQEIVKTWSSDTVPVDIAKQATDSTSAEALVALEARVLRDDTVIESVKQEVVERVKRQRLILDESKKVVSAAQCSFGTVQEEKSRAQYASEQSTSVAHDNKFHKRWLGSMRSGRPWGIGGRVDGMDEQGRVVEIKNRVRCFFRTIPDYEAVQLQTYMAMLDVEEAVLVQQYGGNQRKTVVTRDRDEWERTIMPALERFVTIMDMFLDRPEWRQQWVQASKETREELLLAWETELTQ